MPSDDSLPPHMTDTHLKESLTIALRILERYERDHRHLSDEEAQLLSKVHQRAKAVTADQPAAAVHAAATNGSHASSVPTGGRMSQLMSKLRGFTQSGAVGVYKDMIASKSDIDTLTDFALSCSDLSLTAEQVANFVLKAIRQISKSISDCQIYLTDPVDDTFLFNPTTGTVMAKDESTSVGRCAKKDELVTVGSRLFLPLHASDELIGVLEMELTESLDEHRMRVLDANVSVAGLTLRNQKLYEGLRWQHTKAEAMLTMATRLSRDNLEEQSLVQSIMNTAKALTESDRCSIFVVKGDLLHAYFEDGAVVTMSIDSGIAGHVAKTGETVNILDAYQDPRFNSSVDKATGYRTNTILCMPVLYEGTIVAVAQLINKLDRVNKDGTRVRRVFNRRDEELFATFSTFTGVSLRNCRINVNLLKEKKKSEAILDVVTLLSKTDIRDVNKICQHVMLGAKKLLSADRSSLFLVDKERNELYSTVADSTGGQVIRFASGKGISGVVASTGIGENIKDAYQDERFNRDIDKQFGYRTQSVLCEPISLNGDVLAVAQLMNKQNEDGEVVAFTVDDQESFRTFALFASISISNSHLLDFAVRAGKEAMELTAMRENGGLIRRESTTPKLVAITPSERQEVTTTRVAENLDVTSRDFNLWDIREGGNPKAPDAAAALVMQLLLSTGFPQKFGCTEVVLLNFVLQCRRKYRSVPYHNFFHVVDVCQTMYTFLFEGKMIGTVVTELDAFVLLLTTLVHDLDHMGVNNSFHLKTDSPLGILSSASGNNSVLEVHHCNLAIEILSDNESNVFMGLSEADRTYSYRCLIDCVLATDMARHGELVNNYVNMVKDGYSFEDEAKRRLVMMMVLKAGDISNVTKPFEISRLWAQAVTEEFYKQGDMEKEKGVAVLPMFDRAANNELAKGQIGFINFVAGPFFEKLCTGPLLGLQWTTETVTLNKATWQGLLDAAANSQTQPVAAVKPAETK